MMGGGDVKKVNSFSFTEINSKTIESSESMTDFEVYKMKR